MKSLMMIAAMGGMLAISSFGATVNRREVDQQHRIAQGVNSGQLRPRETARLESREARVDREVRRDRRGDNGRLTGAEYHRVTRQQNQVSRAIYRDKHNSAQR